VLPKVLEFYQSFVAEENIAVVDDMASGHNMPTNHYGNQCSTSSSPWIARCDFKGAFQMLQHIYGDLEEPTEYGGTLPGTFYLFDQTEFFDYNPSLSNMDTAGYIYEPSGCEGEFKKRMQRDSCSVDGPEREDCGFPGITPEECFAEGCCYDDSVPEVPWCFQPD
jgi:hypothetical protein